MDSNDLQQPQIPVALTIAGSDSSAGAGIQADLKTFSALGVYGLTAVTCVVAETPGKVARIEPVPSKTVRKQIELLCTNFPVGAIKTGLLCSAEIVTTVARSSTPRTDRVSAALWARPLVAIAHGTPRFVRWSSSSRAPGSGRTRLATRA